MPFDSPINRFSGIRTFAGKGGTPITNWILIVNAVTFFTGFLFPPAINVLEKLAFVAPHVVPAAWTLVTYPFVSFDIFSLAFSGMFLWFAGGSIERSWGEARYAGFMAGTSIATALSLSLGCELFHIEGIPLAGMYFPAGCAGMAFCMVMPEDTISVWFVTLKRKYFALAIVVLAWVMFGTGRPLFGLFACGGLLAAYLYTTYGRSWQTRGYAVGAPGKRVLRLDFDERKPLRRYPDGSFRRRPYDLIGKWQDAQERKKLDRLLKNSGFDDSEWHEDDRRRS